MDQGDIVWFLHCDWLMPAKVWSGELPVQHNGIQFVKGTRKEGEDLNAANGNAAHIRAIGTNHTGKIITYWDV